jgi:hypothetical protein
MMQKYNIRPIRVKEHGSHDCGGPELEWNRAHEDVNFLSVVIIVLKYTISMLGSGVVTYCQIV